MIRHQHPFIYISWLFQGSQLKWVSVTKKANAIHMSVKKLLFYLADASVTLRNDHLPLERFLQKTTFNKKVNYWDVELSYYIIQFKFITGVQNTLIDTLSRLTGMVLTKYNSPEKEGHEYGCTVSELI